VWFHPKIGKPEDAVQVVKVCSTIFYIFAAMQIGVAFLIFAASPDVLRYAGLSPDAIINYLATAIIIASVASALRNFNSRTAAILLLLLSLSIAATTIYNKQQKIASGNLFLAIVAIVTSIEAIRATFVFHGRIKETPTTVAASPDRPKADFVSHPKGGVESTAASAAASQPPKSYDREKWAALLKYDDEIAIVAGRMSHLGQRWLDELAHAYLALNDKKYLDRIEKKIYADAHAEAVRSRL
jgi:hypothetical protein